MQALEAMLTDIIKYLAIFFKTRMCNQRVSLL